MHTSFKYGVGGIERNHDVEMEWYKKDADNGHEVAIEIVKQKILETC